jgi:hypothetical protein
MWFILTLTVRNLVRGRSTKRPAFAEIEPVLLNNGTYAVGVEVVDDLDFELGPAKIAALNALPRVDLATLQPLLPSGPRAPSAAAVRRR